MMDDWPDPDDVPQEVRMEALRLADAAVRDYLDELDGGTWHLDFGGRLQLLGRALDELAVALGVEPVN